MLLVRFNMPMLVNLSIEANTLQLVTYGKKLILNRTSLLKMQVFFFENKPKPDL